MVNKFIYFNIRSHSRERMWDTIKYASEVCNVLTPNRIKQRSSIVTYNKFQTSLISKLKYEVSKYVLNFQKIDKMQAKNADFLYLWGAFPKNSDKPFIVELDNPYSLAYYHIDNFKRNKNKIISNLKKAKKIVYMSDACKNHSLELFGKEFEGKSFINYPYMQENYKKNKRNKNIINFIFVGLDYKRKGGNEVLESFYHIKNKNIKLTFISNVSNEIKAKYQNDTRINILPPQPREKLLNEIYPEMDIMVFPSFHESFGVVLLEALSYGMGIITVNTYATPEMVKDKYNGKLLHHPIIKPTLLNNTEIVNVVNLRIKEFYDRYLSYNEFYYGLYKELKEAINESVDNYKLWQENSLELFDKKFSPKVWIKNFTNIIE